MIATVNLNNKKSRWKGECRYFLPYSDLNGEVGQPKSIPQSPAIFLRCGVLSGGLADTFLFVMHKAKRPNYSN